MHASVCMCICDYESQKDIDRSDAVNQYEARVVEPQQQNAKFRKKKQKKKQDFACFV